jgi:subtilisin family serine protease
LGQSSLGRSIGIGGLGGPGEGVVSLGIDGQSVIFEGTSVATPFVTGAAALLWSLFPSASGAEIKAALLNAGIGSRRSVTPPLLNAWRAYETLTGNLGRSAVP